MNYFCEMFSKFLLTYWVIGYVFLTLRLEEGSCGIIKGDLPK